MIFDDDLDFWPRTHFRIWYIPAKRIHALLAGRIFPLYIYSRYIYTYIYSDIFPLYIVEFIWALCFRELGHPLFLWIECLVVFWQATF